MAWQNIVLEKNAMEKMAYCLQEKDAYAARYSNSIPHAETAYYNLEKTAIATRPYQLE